MTIRVHEHINFSSSRPLVELKLLSPAKVKEKALMALSVRKLIERGWLTALLGYLIKRGELSVRLKYIGDIRLRRTTFGALAITTYYASKCWPKLPEDLAKTGRLLKPQEAPLAGDSPFFGLRRVQASGLRQQGLDQREPGEGRPRGYSGLRQQGLDQREPGEGRPRG